MPETPKPGRIETPVRLASAKPADNQVGNQQEVGQTTRTQYSTRGKSQTTKKTAAVNVNKRITMLGQIVFIAFGLLVDGTQFFLDLIYVGVIVNRIIDIVVAGIFFLYALLKGLSMAEDAKVYASIAGTVAGEFIPGIDIAPFFTIDAWYITQAIKKKDKLTQKTAQKAVQSATDQQDRQEFVENYQQQNQENQEEELQVEEQNALINEQANEVTPPTQNSSAESNETKQPNNPNQNTRSESHDALEELNNRKQRGVQDNAKLMRAQQIMRTGVIDDKDKSDPVLFAAWNKSNSGQHEYHPINNPKGFKFSNGRYF